MTTLGVGTHSVEEALGRLENMTSDIIPIGENEHRARIEKAQAYMRANDIAAVYLNAGTNLSYFTGLKWYASERMVGAILPAEGDFEFIAPYFEIGSLNDYMKLKGKINAWQEHESPYALFAEVLKQMGIAATARIGIDESAAFFIFDGIRQCAPELTLINGKEVTAHCRMQKSPAELAIIKRTMEMTLEVHKAAASILREGISTKEVEAFIERAHQKVGAPGNYFCIVLFGEATSYPHGVKDPQHLKEGDMVLIDTGCKIYDYLSDITRTYVFGTPTARQRECWNIEKAAQAAAFEAAKPGIACEQVDLAARQTLASFGMGPEYQLPGCPHRTGHGIGMDIHEWPYLVKGNELPLAEGMCFSNEPMLVVPGEFGVRLEDHFYITEDGAAWFTEPSLSIDDPFGIA